MNHLLYILAIWRITSLVASEDGPYKIFERFRDFLAKTLKYGVKADCFWCMSVWVSLFVVWGIQGDIIHWLAYSAGAILVEEVTWAVRDARGG